MNKIPLNKKYLTLCIAIALLLCVTQIMGNLLLVLGCLAVYMMLVAWCCSYDFTLPVLLFFLPWSPILRANPTSYSFYTFGMVLICLISVIKKRGTFRKYHIKAGIIIAFLSLLSKLLDDSRLSFDYIAFLMMLFLFPVVKEEWQEKKYDFFQVVSFFAIGVVIASICALNFADYSNIRKFIRVDEYLTIVRRSGFYGDANFYTAQILAALGGALALILQEKKKSHIVSLGILILLLLYCGFLSGSKSFAIVAALVLLLWIVAILKMRGRAGLKVVLLAFFALGAAYIATSVMFSGLIEVLLTRFSFSTDLESFTTGRTGLWLNYFKEIMGDAKIFFLGRGFTDIKVNGRASHSTIIQLFYQFGLLGVPVLIYWTICFFRELSPGANAGKRFDIKILIVCVGAFMPWLAIDTLFFDEFFLLQWYVLMALNQSQFYVQADKIETSSDGGKLWTRK